MNAFLRSAATVLETDEVGFDTDFRALPGWCSLQGFGLLVMMENEWSAPMDLDAFLAAKNLGDLFAEAFIALAAEVFGTERERLSPASAFGSVPEWDSVNHLRLVMEAEKRFGFAYPMEAIAEMKTLSGFIGRAAEAEAK